MPPDTWWEPWAETLEELMRIPLAGRIGAGAVFQPPPSGFSVFDPDESVEVARSLLPEKRPGRPALRPGSRWGLND